MRQRFDISPLHPKPARRAAGLVMASMLVGMLSACGGESVQAGQARAPADCESDELSAGTVIFSTLNLSMHSAPATSTGSLVATAARNAGILYERALAQPDGRGEINVDGTGFAEIGAADDTLTVLIQKNELVLPGMHAVAFTFDADGRTDVELADVACRDEDGRYMANITYDMLVSHVRATRELAR